MHKTLARTLIAMVMLFLFEGVASAKSPRPLVSSSKSVAKPAKSIKALKAVREIKLAKGIEKDLLGKRKVTLNLGQSKLGFNPKERRSEGRGQEVVYGLLDKGRGEGLFMFERGRLKFASITDYGRDRAFSVYKGKQGKLMMEEFSGKEFPGCGGANSASGPKEKESAGDSASVDISSSGNYTIAADGSIIIDVMVVWTPEVEAARGADGAKALAEASIAATNQAYLNSGVHQRVNLVYAGRLANAETSSQSDML